MEAAFANWIVDMVDAHYRWARDQVILNVKIAICDARIQLCNARILWCDAKIFWYS